MDLHRDDDRPPLVPHANANPIVAVGHDRARLVAPVPFHPDAADLLVGCREERIDEVSVGVDDRCVDTLALPQQKAQPGRLAGAVALRREPAVEARGADWGALELELLRVREGGHAADEERDGQDGHAGASHGPRILWTR
jgi:hypothetical protein